VERETLGRLHLCESDFRLACQAILLGPLVSIERLVPASVEDEEARALIPEAALASVAGQLRVAGAEKTPFLQL
jgi:hypothetical protein